MPSINTILFDLDGTLVDTEKTAVRVTNELLEKWGVSVAPSVHEEVTGRTWGVALDLLYRRYEFPLPQDQAMDEILTAYHRALEQDLEPVAGAAEAVRALSKNFALGLVSGSFRRQIIWALDQLNVRELFQVILGAEDYPLSKPAPDGYLKALKILDKKPENTLVFEDSAPGIESARSAGAWVVAVTSTNHFAQKNELAHLRVPDLRNVTPEWVAEISKAFSS